jgi:hypothetical protein
VLISAVLLSTLPALAAVALNTDDRPNSFGST